MRNFYPLCETQEYINFSYIILLHITYTNIKRCLLDFIAKKESFQAETMPPAVFSFIHAQCTVKNVFHVGIKSHRIY